LVEESKIEPDEEKDEHQDKSVTNLRGKIIKKAVLLAIFIAIFIISLATKDLEFIGTNHQSSNSSNTTVE
jgi:hypothetical protein